MVSPIIASGRARTTANTRRAANRDIRAASLQTRISGSFDTIRARARLNQDPKPAHFPSPDRSFPALIPSSCGTLPSTSTPVPAPSDEAASPPHKAAPHLPPRPRVHPGARHPAHRSRPRRYEAPPPGSDHARSSMACADGTRPITGAGRLTNHQQIANINVHDTPSTCRI